MNFINKYNVYFIIVLFCSVCVILFIISGLSISYQEAIIYFDKNNLTSKLAHLSTSLLGQNDYALRIPNIIFFVLNLSLIYLISNRILKHRVDSILCVVIYALIPGVIMQGVLLNESSIMLFFVLLICYIEIATGKIAYPLFIISIFISSSAFMLFLALFFYALSKKRINVAIFALICFSINMYIYGIDVGGKPRGEFLDVIGELALLYSPPLFIYYVYTLYRNITKEKQNLLLYVSVCSLIVSFILSIRQEINKEIFLFMSLCGIPLMIRQFLSDIRVRLPRFQNAYRNRFIIVLVFLIFEALLLIFSKSLYLVVENPNKSFLKSFYIAKEVSHQLKERNISRVTINNQAMQKRLEFYGIRSGGQPLREVSKNGNIIVTYYGRIVARYAI
ncbi:hypothetical protein CCY99_08835 [Helicobacter sp. 16-1353]|uniref:ArnT family glycosyltransferase n=1 Tax=Helicobacter sp. 16-1353 TaxID=2004996 RepID=UPI000DCF4094|nr:glycosyltransferase family 39 protein [Helicobacter sp. 16-1353]RAX51557.1 hypothetical protein CCY99_08835 [Helicobacter sp. 16-1353]